jgi:hypothetical protein
MNGIRIFFKAQCFMKNKGATMLVDLKKKGKCRLLNIFNSGSIRLVL